MKPYEVNPGLPCVLKTKIGLSLCLARLHRAGESFKSLAPKLEIRFVPNCWHEEETWAHIQNKASKSIVEGEFDSAR